MTMKTSKNGKKKNLVVRTVPMLQVKGKKAYTLIVPVEDDEEQIQLREDILIGHFIETLDLMLRKSQC